MGISLTFDEVMTYKGEYTVVPIAKEMVSDMVTPIAYLARIKEHNERCFLLESADGDGNHGRYTFLGYDPLMRLRATAEGVEKIVSTGQKETSELIKEDINQVLRDLLQAYKAPHLEALPPFTGGLVGYFSYDYISAVESVLQFTSPDELSLPYYDVMLFQSVIAFDHRKQKLFLISHVPLGEGRVGYDKGVEKIHEMEAFLLGTTPNLLLDKMAIGSFTSNVTKSGFIKMVEKAKQYITEGDIFQVVLSQRFTAPCEGTLLSAYRQLRMINPSEYMFYLHNEEVEIAGASPETLVKIKDGRISNLPIAGTRKRGETQEEDESLATELLGDEKELAEHTMLVDLGRNDVGRVSRFGTVQVSRLMKIARFSHVMHIVSEVAGEMAPDKDVLHVLGSILPAGTLSGAPKLRACEIIDELEPSRRGFYGGGLGYIDFSGQMDTCITIRSIIKKDGYAHIQAGAGIVADSIPEKEYEESVHKSMAMIKALEAVKKEG